MARTKTRLFTDVCPETGKRQTIRITFQDIEMCMNPGDEKATEYYCPYAFEHGCETRGERQLDCPLYKVGRNPAIYG